MQAEKTGFESRRFCDSRKKRAQPNPFGTPPAPVSCVRGNHPQPNGPGVVTRGRVRNQLVPGRPEASPALTGSRQRRKDHERLEHGAGCFVRNRRDRPGTRLVHPVRLCAVPAADFAVSPHPLVDLTFWTCPTAGRMQAVRGRGKRPRTACPGGCPVRLSTRPWRKGRGKPNPWKEC